MARRLGAVALALALSVVAAVPGADHEVQQVTGPHVEKEDVGPFMEVGRSHKRHATGCLSCTLGGMGTSSHSSNSYSTASYGMAGGTTGYGAVSNPQSASSRREFRREEQYVNGQPVYQLQHERRYQDGRLVHDERVEKDEDDLGYSPGSSGGHYGSQASMTRSSSSGSRYGHDGYYTRPGYNTVGMSDATSQSYGASESGYSSSQSHDHFQRNFEEEVDRMRNQLRNTMESHMSQQPPYGGSSRSEYHYQTRYVNGQPVYQREGDVKYEDGQLVHNRTQEVGSRDQGSYVGAYDRNQEHQGYHSTSSQASHNTHPGYTYYPSRGEGYSSYNQWQSSYSNNSPTSGYPSVQQPTHGSSSTAHREYSSQSSSSSSAYPARRPGYDTSSSMYGEDSSYSSSSYPHSSPSSGSSSTHYSEEDRRHSSSSYPGYRPTSDASTGSYRPTYGSSSTHYSEDRSRSSSSYQPNYRPTYGSSSTTYRDESYHSSASNPSNQPATTTHTPADLDVTRVQQNVGISSSHHPSTTTTHHASQESSYRRESQGGYRQTHSHGGRYRGRGHTDTSEEDHDEHYGTTSGGARTVTLDLSNPNSGSSPSFSDHLLRPNHSGRRHDTDDEDDLQQQTDNDLEHSQGNVGIPGVLSGPHTPHGNEDDHDENEDDENSERYDISPLEDGHVPTLPTVDNEIETGHATIPRHDGSLPDRPNTQDDSDSEYQPHRTRPRGSGTSSATYHYTHTRRNEGEETRHVSPSGTPNRPGYSHTTTRDGSSYVRPISGSSTYHYNETRRRTSTASGQHQQPVPGSHSSTYASSSSSSCTYGDGCVIHGEPQTNSRRSEIRTTRRYVNGRLVGMTTHERQYENGVMVNENRTEYDRDEVARMYPEEASASQMDLSQDSYHPESYSQQHEFRTEKRFFNGQPVYELNHERRYEDGALVYNNRTEKNEDDFQREGAGTGQLGVTSVHGNSGHEATHTRHHHRVTSDRTSNAQSTQHSQGRQTGDTTRVLTVPVYSSRRYESRREQEYVDGQPVYDLHHERRFQDGSLVHENRTELNEDDLAGGGHHDALHDILAGNTYVTATQAPHGRPVQTGYGASTYSSHSSSSYGTSSGHTTGSFDRTGDSYDQTSGSYGQTSGSYGQTSESSDESSSTYSQSKETHGRGYGSQDHTNTGSGSFTSSLLSRGNVGSGRATTTVLGGSGTLLTGSDSTRSLEDRNDNSHESGSATYSSSHSSSSHVQGSGGSGSYVPAYGSYGHSTDDSSSEDSRTQSRVQSSYGESGSQFGSVLSQGSRGSGRATTTVLGGSGSETSSGYSGTPYGSSYESQSSTSQVRQSGGSGCLSCVLMRGGNGEAGQNSHGYGGTGGRSYRREMSVEEHYEDGRLVQGRQDSRRYEDGNLIHEDTRHYSDDQEAQFPRAEALGSQSSSSSSSSHSSSSSSYSSSSSSSSSESEVCDPNPCLNGGTCLPGLYDAICTCQFGFTGRRCEEAECPRGYCRRGGECSIKDGHHVCSCRAGYEGPRCMERSERRFRRSASRP